MIVFDRTQQKTIHTRSIETAIFEGATPQTLVVEGVLKDERLMAAYKVGGECRPPETVHHMIIRMEIQRPELTITGIEVEMPTLPHPECIETQASLAPIQGMRVAAGFTSQVRKRIGGTRGCVHLLALLTAMAPAVFQGAWSATVREPVDPERYRGMSGSLIDTCWVWRADGPLAARWRQP